MLKLLARARALQTLDPHRNTIRRCCAHLRCWRGQRELRRVYRVGVWVQAVAGNHDVLPDIVRGRPMPGKTLRLDKASFAKQ